MLTLMCFYFSPTYKIWRENNPLNANIFSIDACQLMKAYIRLDLMGLSDRETFFHQMVQMVVKLP